MKVLAGVPRPPRPRACCAKYCGHQPVPALGPASGLSPPAHSELGSPEESAWSESRIADFGLGGFQKTNWTTSMPAVRVFRVQTHLCLLPPSLSCFLLLLLLLLPLPRPALFCSLHFLSPYYLLSATPCGVFFSSPARSRFLFVGAEPDSLLSRTLSSTRSGAPASHVAITSQKPQAEGKGPKQRAGRFSAKFPLVDQPTSTIDSSVSSDLVARSSPASFE